jgi:hypothetical protein
MTLSLTGRSLVLREPADASAPLAAEMTGML